jgi:hypothetical protein
MSKIYTALGHPSVGQPIVKPMKPPKFPMKFKEFLRRMFGGRLHSDRLRLYRKYLLDQFEVEVWFKGSMRELAGRQSLDSKESRIAAAEKLRDGFVAKLSNEGVADPEWYEAVAPEIQRWRGLNRVAQRKAAIKSRWDKEKSKKILELPKTEESGISKDKKCSLVSKKGKKVTGSYPKK